MVQHGHFTVHLVDADTKTPFPEHEKDGKVFVEVEPDCEYFICIQKTTCGSGNETDGRPRHKGLRPYQDGVETMTALKFTKPRVDPHNSAQSRLLMGKVELKVYEGIFVGRQQPRNIEHAFQTTRVSLGNSGPKKRDLRSGEGSVTVFESTKKKSRKFKRRRHLDTIVLNCCTAVGLMEAGVFPKAGAWVNQNRMTGRGYQDHCRGQENSQSEAS